MEDKKIIINNVDVSGCKYINSYQIIVRNNECIVGIQNACVEEIETKPCSQKHNCYFKNWQRKEQELNKAKQIILQAVDDFSLEYGTPYYDKLLESAKLLGIEVKDYE